METKTCSKCGRELSVDEFDKTKNGYSSWCKNCRREYARQYTKLRRKNDPLFREASNEAKRKYRNSAEGQATDKQYREGYRSNPDVRDHEKKYGAAYYRTHKSRRMQTAVEWIKQNPEKAKEYRKRASDARRSDPVKNLSDRVRSSIKKAVKRKGLCKDGMSFQLLGYPPAEVYQHLKKYLGKSCEVCKSVIVTMQNCHLDHIKPVCSADTLDEVLTLNQLQNLRLICKKCNLQKGARYE